MISRIRFENYKALRDATLPLGPFTLIVGPNGSGKSTVFQALESLHRVPFPFDTRLSAGAKEQRIRVIIELGSGPKDYKEIVTWDPQPNRQWLPADPPRVVQDEIHRLRIFSLDPRELAREVPLTPRAQLESNGAGLATVLDRLRDEAPERFAALNAELHRWLPEFDSVLFETPHQGSRGIVLRTSRGGHRIPASELSHGALLSLGILTLAYAPDAPRLACFEEPERGIHPRLLRDVRDALYRLSHPDQVGEARSPVQVIATTHSPYFLDLYRERPEEVVLANKQGLEVTFERLSDREDLDEILADSHLGDAWYTGILGGVPANE